MSKAANFNPIRDELILIINEWDRPSPLRGIAKIKYLRELKALYLNETTMRVTLQQQGYAYKYKGKRPPVMTFDTNAIRTVLNEKLTTAVVTTVVQENQEIYLTLEVIE